MNASAATTEPGDAPAARRRSRQYLVIPLLMIAIALIGFWPQYYRRLLTGAPLEGVALHPLVHLHSTLFLAWLGIIVFQAALVHRGRTALHRRLGPWLAAFGYAAATTGLVAGIELAAAQVERGRPLDGAATFVAAPILDMIMFAGFLTASIAWRRRPEVHKRLVLFTGYSFAFIGLVRYLLRIPGTMDNLWLGTVLLTVPILLCILWEYATRRRFHPVWWIGLAVFTLRLLLELLAMLPAWLPVGRFIVQAAL